MSPAQPSLAVLVATRAALHGAAELLLAGPQYRASGEIQLRVEAGGFATFTGPGRRVDVDTLVGDGRRVPLVGTTYRRAAAELRIEAGAPAGVYGEGSGAEPDDPVDVDAEAAAYLAECFALGDRALRRFAAGQSPVLWPEHFDVGITVDEVNYGVSPGDTAISEPYAYVGPRRRHTGDFWNVAFGAARPVRELVDVSGLVDFFTQGRRQAGLDPLAG
jgi:hypothetical protein